MEIRGVDAKLGLGQVNPAGNGKPQPAAAPEATNGDGDQVQLSGLAQHLAAYHAQPAVRQDKVDAARDALAKGKLDDDQKLSIALDRLLEDVLSN